MRNSFSKLQYLLFALLLFSLTGCGASNVAGTSADNGGGSSSVTGKLVWAESGKTTAKTVSLIPAGVTTVSMAVTGASQKIPARSTMQVTAGQTEGTGTVSGIYPGKINLAVKATSADGTVLYEGFALNINVAAAATTNVGTVAMFAPVVKPADAGCLNCHETTLDAKGRNVVAAYKTSSGHYTETTTGCAACHGPSHNSVDPAALVAGSSKCIACHTATPFASHNNYDTAVNKCTTCHEAHNTKEFRDFRGFAASAHGDPAGAAWEHYDFTIRDACNACHTAAGFVKAIGNDWSDTLAPSTTISSGKKALTCDGCHSKSTDYKTSVRTIPGNGFKAGMGGYGLAAKATLQYPNVGESNVCVPCHAGRENGASIIASATAGSNFKNPHYLAAAAVFYGNGGFRYYGDNGKAGTPSVTVAHPTDGSYTGNVPAYSSEYGVIRDGIIITSSNIGATPLGTSMVGKYANWNHGKIGMENYNNSGTQGQCVACHLGPKNTHTFDAYEVAETASGVFDIANGAWSTSGTPNGCFGCHGGEDMKEVAEFEEKPIFDRLLNFFKWNLQQFGLYYDGANNPYFFTAPYVAGGTNTSFTSWAVPVGGDISDFQKTMGAAHNFKLIDAEKGAHVHNRAYMRHLIFDSIQYLQFGAVTYSNSKFYPTLGSENLENVIKFSAYSTAVTPAGGGLPNNLAGNAVSIQQLKNYIISSSSRTNPIDLATGVVPSPATFGAMKYFRR